MSRTDELRAAGLGAVAQIIEANGRETVRLGTLPMEEEDFVVGQSKLGGLPHLPQNMEWPRYKDQPLYFLAQIRLKDLPDCAAARQLPASGTLYFFHEGETVWGFDPKDAGGFRVLYVPDGVPLTPRDPGEESCTFDGACAVEFSVETEYPENMEILDDMGLLDGLSEADQAKLSDIFDGDYGGNEDGDGDDGENEDDFDGDDEDDLDEDGFGEETGHKLFGWPDLIQGDIFAECQFASNGVYCGNGDKADSEKAAFLRSGVRDWTLLFQLDSDDDAGMMWGDVGRLYFCIRKDDLKARNFDKVWTILQCY